PLISDWNFIHRKSFHWRHGRMEFETHDSSFRASNDSAANAEKLTRLRWSAIRWDSIHPSRLRPSRRFSRAVPSAAANRWKMKTSKKKIRYAVVGLGHIAQVAVLPAFAHAKNSELAALITGDPKKEQKLSRKYGAPAFNYDDFETAIREKEIDAVY